MSVKTYKFKVEMTCESCANAVKRCLTKAFGDQLKQVDTDVATQAVVVHLDNSGQQFTDDQVLEAVKKSGKTVTRVD
ncbi:copper transport protein ATOX1-like [Oppia nitens]|uniref:copper transport protein ATOX1-like n=1 Tax=Oppia nitens TaxID=1686743 RepID=UPI0023DC39BB|nr:copper transport protein ATOX1-like [Oppia nitens]